MSVLMVCAASPARKQSRKQSVGDHPSVSRTPSQTTGVRKPWRMLSSGARSLLCLRATNHQYKGQWGSDEHRGVLPHARPASDISFFGCSQSDEALLRRTSTASTSKTQQLYTGNHHHHHQPMGTNSEHRLPAPQAAAPAAANIKEGYKAPLMGSPPTLRVGNGGGDGPEVDLPIRIRSRSRAPDGKANRDGERSFRSGEDADARRAWEAMKRRVLYIEEHGSLPDDDEDAVKDGAERASRERRARRRKGWAEEAILGKAQEDARAAKKRRRNGGCWTCENGILMRLQARRSESTSRL